MIANLIVSSAPVRIGICDIVMSWLAMPMAALIFFLSSRLRRDNLVSDLISHVLYIPLLICTFVEYIRGYHLVNVYFWFVDIMGGGTLEDAQEKACL